MSAAFYLSLFCACLLWTWLVCRAARSAGRVNQRGFIASSRRTQRARRHCVCGRRLLQRESHHGLCVACGQWPGRYAQHHAILTREHLR